MLCSKTKVLLLNRTRKSEKVVAKTLTKLIGRQSAQWVTIEQVESSDSNIPTIIVCIYESPEKNEYKERLRVRPNNVEYLDIFFSTHEGTSNPAPLSVNDNQERLETAFSIAEQKILQRHRPRTKGIHDDFYLRFNLVGQSISFKRSMRAIVRVAKTDSRVIIRGETGTGKEIAARAIHHFSGRSSKPFIPINCGAFSDDLLLSELFGHTKGAFTGADSDRQGLLEHASSGTLFLDEVDELTPRAQVALLRFLQEGEIRPVGGRKVRKVDVRVLSASNKDLKPLVRSGKFREDLLYRLDVLPVTLPPLRMRDDDILLVSQKILGQIQQELNQPPKFLSPAVIDEIRSNEWLGNFREIESALLRAFIMSNTEIISDSSLLYSEEVFEKLTTRVTLGSFRSEKDSLIRAFEKDYLERVLKEASGNISHAAKIAHKERRAFARLMAKHGIDRASFVTAKQAS